MCYKSGTVSRQHLFCKWLAELIPEPGKVTLLLLLQGSVCFGAYSQTWFLGWYNNCKFFKYEVF
jgi:hypothetical protein